MSRIAALFVVITASLLASCSSIRYYSQAIGGQLDILGRSQPITELLDGPDPSEPRHVPLTPQLRQRLETAQRIREFATTVLHLPDNGSYSVYADLGRNMVAWNVIATPEFSLTPKEWCYPFAGCVPYRGYFSRNDAEQEAADLRTQGLDVRVAGVAAYSTLGWFRDPILNTHLQRSDTELAALIFHELAHQLLYLPGDAAFNESFATTVEIEGLRRWLDHTGNPEAFAADQADRARQAEFVALVRSFRERLVALYATDLEPVAMRRAKARVFAELRDAHSTLKQRWGGTSRYDHWFAQDLNNAHLASVELYHQHVPAFQALLARVGHDLPRFYRAARRLGHRPPEDRAADLNRLTLTAR